MVEVRSNLRNRVVRFAYRLGHLLGRWRPRGLRRKQGVAVAVWRGNRLLVVRHSYEPGHFLPGGSPRRHESLRDAACRELREETGIDADPAALVAVFTTAWVQVLEYCPCRTPELRVDGGEVVEARFVEPSGVADLPPFVHDYLLGRGVGSGRPARGPDPTRRR